MRVLRVMLKASQIRAARAMLQLSQQEFAELTSLSRDTIKQAETDGARIFDSSLRAIEEFLKSRGFSFSGDEERVWIAMNAREGLGAEIQDAIVRR